MSSTTLPVCPKTGSTSPSLTVHLCLHTAPGNRECAQHINATADAFLAEGQPVISVDTKKKELVGNFKNGGREWQPKGTPPAVLVHDFPTDAEGKAIPYGVYDMARNEAWVNVGWDHDTPAFAVASIRHCWHQMGCGPGTSKWNKIEHRLFCHITANWRGTPLRTYETGMKHAGSVQAAMQGEASTAQAECTLASRNPEAGRDEYAPLRAELAGVSEEGLGTNGGRRNRQHRGRRLGYAQAAQQRRRSRQARGRSERLTDDQGVRTARRRVRPIPHRHAARTGAVRRHGADRHPRPSAWAMPRTWRGWRARASP